MRIRHARGSPQSGFGTENQLADKKRPRLYSVASPCNMGLRAPSPKRRDFRQSLSEQLERDPRQRHNLLPRRPPMGLVRQGLRRSNISSCAGAASRCLPCKCTLVINEGGSESTGFTPSDCATRGGKGSLRQGLHRPIGQPTSRIGRRTDADGRPLGSS